MKKGQVVTQIFIYVVSAAIFLAILLVGFNAISSLLANADLVLLSDFQTKLTKDVNFVKSTKGRIEIEPYRTPAKYTKLCIVDSAGGTSGTLENKYPQFHNAWLTGTENVFLVPKQPVAIYIPDIQLEAGYVCVNISGVFNLRIEGLGRGVAIRSE